MLETIKMPEADYYFQPLVTIWDDTDRKNKASRNTFTSKTSNVLDRRDSGESMQLGSKSMVNEV